ncbi:hypothetical protein PR002_g20583 [Phytophthora rubi]|uniref:Protein kinase domain-containing protein n=1 Tax=Phytophthora rubi TaxID=129364 RepID=A0A6A3JAK3_9STRA|nr:hypothetical protein PR002_g20583 [Phytophthora rubi]
MLYLLPYRHRRNQRKIKPTPTALLPSASTRLRSRPQLYIRHKAGGLTFATALSKGASGEVWICQYNERTVVGKKLLGKNRRPVKLSASLAHPNIVEFIGVAWNSLNNLVMVIEFIPMWSVRKYLKRVRF